MLKFHPLADLFPLMEGDEFKELCASIADGGLDKPIVRYEDKILDGRNRARACEKSGVKPRYEDYDGDDPLGFVMAANYHRRHLSASQRAMIFAEFTRLAAHRPRNVSGNNPLFSSEKEGENPIRGQNCPLSIGDAADAATVSKRTMKDARKVSENGTAATIKKVKAGKKSVSEAAAEIREKEKSTETKTKTPAQQLRAAADDFAGEVNRIAHQLDVLAQWAEGQKAAAETSPLGKTIHWLSVIENLRSTRKRLHQGRRVNTCPYCKGEGKDKSKACKGCDGTGSVTAVVYKAGCEAMGVPEEIEA